MLNKKALAGTPSTPPVYVDDVFSTFLYSGTGATQTITNDIDLSGKGGLVWIKARTAPVFSGASNHAMFDTVRGANKFVSSNTPDPAATYTNTLNSFNSNGFSLGVDSSVGVVNYSTHTYCSWTFREQAKFFDVVTYTGNGTAGRTVAHNLGSVPGMMLVKKIGGSPSEDWAVYHRSLGNTKFLILNKTDAEDTLNRWNNTTPTSTVFTVSSDGMVNASGATYVAYLFAHDAGGFGTSGTDNVISCGSFTTDGSGIVPAVNLGYEPQYILAKRTDSGTQGWIVFDVMREWSMTNQRGLAPNTSGAEINFTLPYFVPSATGFYGVDNYFGVNAPVIYMAIRRPMKPPTSGTSVFYSGTGNGSTTVPAYVTNFPVDAGWLRLNRTGTTTINFLSRLTGAAMATSSTGTESTDTDWAMDSNKGFIKGNWGGAGGYTEAFAWAFRRAPGFFDVVCYTGTGSATTVTHNLGVAPEMMIVKRRSSAGWEWAVYSSTLGATKYLWLNTTDAEATNSNYWNDTAPSSTQLNLGASSRVNGGSATYVAYLFASVAGVSKVGSYTGNGSSQTINCGFTAGARFVLIKRTDSTGDWYVFDTARGIVSGNDPFLLLNSTAAEVTTRDAVDPDNSGFIVNNDATNFPINVNNATYIFLAVA